MHSYFCVRYKEGKNSENMEKINIVNSSPLDAEITFCFLNDSKGDVYLLDPPSMSLKPAQQQVNMSFITLPLSICDLCPLIDRLIDRSTYLLLQFDAAIFFHKFQ